MDALRDMDVSGDMNAFWLSLLHGMADQPLAVLFILGAVAGAESILILSLLIPSSVVFLGLGVVLPATELDYLAVWAAASLGAVFGDAIAYGLGAAGGPTLKGAWPFRTRPHVWATAEGFFHRWGLWAILLCKFAGPGRSVVLTLAGAAQTPLMMFFALSILSSAVWCGAMLTPGLVFGTWYFGGP
ncbi:MAG: DedA family protein [Pseudomonadota bacterium]